MADIQLRLAPLEEAFLNGNLARKAELEHAQVGAGSSWAGARTGLRQSFATGWFSWPAVSKG